MNFIRVVCIERCRVASFHVASSLTPEDDVFALYTNWAERNGLVEKHRFIPLIGHNNPWGPEGKKRGYELFCVLDNLGNVDLTGVKVKEFQGGLFAVITIAGLDRIMQGIELARKWIKQHPKYKLSYPDNYRHGVDPVPEYEVVYTPNAKTPEEFILDYYVPVTENF